jgi:hypothetical protein
MERRDDSTLKKRRRRSIEEKRKTIMPQKNTKTAKTSKRRTKTKKLGAARDLGATETKKVKGGVTTPQTSAIMGDGSVKPASSIQDGTSNAGVHFKY